MIINSRENRACTGVGVHLRGRHTQTASIRPTALSPVAVAALSFDGCAHLPAAIERSRGAGNTDQARWKAGTFLMSAAAWKDTLGIIAFGQPTEETKPRWRTSGAHLPGAAGIKPGPHSPFRLEVAA